MPVPQGQPRHAERTLLYCSLDKVGSGHPCDPGRTGAHVGGSARGAASRGRTSGSSRGAACPRHKVTTTTAIQTCFCEHLFSHIKAGSLSFKEKGRQERRKDRREREGAGIRGIKAHSERRRLGSAAPCWTADPPDEVGADVAREGLWLRSPHLPSGLCASQSHTRGKTPVPSNRRI